MPLTFLSPSWLGGAALLLAANPAEVRADNWPQWRGPSANGLSAETNLPVRWSPTENIAWKLPLPSLSGSTPIVWGDRIFLNVADGGSLFLWAVDRNRGATVWKRHLGDGDRRQRKQNMSTPSPVTDGKNVTFVGYDTANPPDSTALGKLGSSSSKWVGKHEGHSGWTIQQDDDLVTGKSTANNDGVNYTGKKVVADFGPHIVLVHLGTNDMYQNPTGADTRLGTLIDHIVAEAPNALVVVSNIIPFPSGASAVSTFNKAVPGVVKQRTDAGKHVVFADQFTGFSTSDLGSDQVHPNEGGYEKMAVVWYAAIKSYLH